MTELGATPRIEVPRNGSLATEEALRERVKELTCLYGITRLAAESVDVNLDELLDAVLNLLPPGWQYPEVTAARIQLDGRTFRTPDFSSGLQELNAPIRVDGRIRGKVTVAYTSPMPEMDEGPFLAEERNLIDGVARQIAVIVARTTAESERREAYEQLQHADRLAVIGQLAAGIAHELNEPLGNILGFAQLARKAESLPDQAAKDIDRIVEASLHAREVIRKLMLFARQSPADRHPIQLDPLIEDGLWFFENRFNKLGVEVVLELESGGVPVHADETLVRQVLVNLVVNALQAMKRGGRLTVRTWVEDDMVAFSIQDDGEGMPVEARERIFLPFYTTKDVGEGTGLGLAVVHGIVKAHRGTIEVESEPGHGSRFIVRLPSANVTHPPGEPTEEER